MADQFTSGSQTSDETLSSSPGYPNAGLLAEGPWLARQLADPHLRVLDVRVKDEYDKGHIPNAISAPLALFRRTVDGVPSMVITAAALEELLGNLGISVDTTVVVYDETGGLDASRVLWTLDYYGHRDVRFLEGGIALWRQEGRPVVTEVPEVQPARYHAMAHPERVATLAEVLACIGKADTVVVDTRSLKEYTGEEVREGTARGGHVPGAVHVDWVGNRTSEQPPRLKSAAELEQIYRAAGVTPGKEVITYCRTAHRASHTYLVLRLLGYPRVRIYDGSWAEWSYHPEAPAEQGTGPRD